VVWKVEAVGVGDVALLPCCLVVSKNKSYNNKCSISIVNDRVNEKKNLLCGPRDVIDDISWAIFYFPCAD
jgi:hypothetical protein